MKKLNGLDAILEAELSLLGDVGAMQERVKEAVEKREWVAFETYNRQIDEAAGRLADLEEARQNSADGDTATAKTAELKRGLKAEIDKIRWTGEAIARYLDEQRTLVGGFIEALYPEKRGTIYSRYGKRADADMRSLVFNEAY
ncbi:MAG: hypothetical protein LBK61_08030 [Spirochaetaceae bacterium]|jgi:hypothetical protein|nr:hypothetical protein [Spirochaetaceae bacterium]